MAVTTMATARSGFMRAAGWSYVMDGGRQGIALLVTFVLAALLGPEVFGLAAMATVYIMFIDLVQRQGMAAALIQRKVLTESHKDSAFWMVLGVSIAMTGVSVGGATLWAAVNRTPALAPVVMALSPLILLQGLVTVQEALLRRAMAFKLLAKRTIAAVVLGGATGLAGAWLGWGVYALVGQQLVYGVVSVAALWSVSGWRPRFHFSRHSARELIGFSSGSFLTSIAVFVNNRADALLIGIFFGPLVVGVYRLGSRLIDAILSGLAGPIRSLALPELSPYQDDPEELTRRADRLMLMGAVAVFPVLGIVAATAEPLTAVLGERWGGSAAVIQVLCLVGAVRVVATIDGPLLQAVGSPFVQAGMATFTAAISALTFSAAGVALSTASPEVQALGVAAARALLYGSFICVIHVLIIRRYAGIGVRRGLAVVGRPFGAGVGAWLCGTMVHELVVSAGPASRLLLTAVVSAGVGTVLTWRWVPGCSELVRSTLDRRRSTIVAVQGNAS